jgi:hypothetical protein
MHVSAEKPFLAMTLNAGSQLGSDLVQWPWLCKQNRQGGEYGCRCCPTDYAHACRDYPSAELVRQETLIYWLVRPGIAPMVEAIFRFGYYIFLLFKLRRQAVSAKEVTRLALRLRPDGPVLTCTPTPGVSEAASLCTMRT